MKKQTEEKELDKEIKEITDKKVLDFMKLNPDKIDQDTFNNLLQQTKVGMIFVRDREMMKRISQGQYIRVFNLISGDKEELQRYVEISMPGVIPKIE